MGVYGTAPDEIRWPEAADFQPMTQVAVAGEDEVGDPVPVPD